MTSVNRVSIEIDPNAPFFAGHFPGDPVAPGGYLLSMVIAQVRSAGFETHRIELSRAKFLRAVRPAEPLSLEWSQQIDKVQFSVLVGREVAVTGLLKLITGSASDRAYQRP